MAPNSPRAARNAVSAQREPDTGQGSPTPADQDGAKHGPSPKQGAGKHSLVEHHRRHLEPRWRKAAFVLRITEWKDSPIPVLVIKERQQLDEDTDSGESAGAGRKGSLIERGHLSGDALRRVLPVLRSIVTPVQDEAGVPLQIQRYLTQDGLRLRVNLPLDEAAGAKLALICRLQERVGDMDRIELMARRVARFTAEEAAYWLSRMTSFGPDAGRWAVAGMRIMLCGQARDAGVGRMLERMHG